MSNFNQEALAAMKAEARVVNPDAYWNVFSRLMYLDNQEGKVRFSINNSSSYEMLQGEYKALFQTLFEKHFIWAFNWSFIIGLRERPKIIRELSAQKLDEYLKANEEFEGKRIINSGVAHTAKQLMGLMCSMHQKNTQDVESIYMNYQEKKRLVFRFNTSYAGFAAARSPTIRDPSTVREHIRRLEKINVLIQTTDGGMRKRASCIWLYFNPDLIEYSYPTDPRN